MKSLALSLALLVIVVAAFVAAMNLVAVVTALSPWAGVLVTLVSTVAVVYAFTRGRALIASVTS